MAPKIEDLANVETTVNFAKFNCGLTNESKKIAVRSAIKALPTFHFYR